MVLCCGMVVMEWLVGLWFVGMGSIMKVIIAYVYVWLCGCVSMRVSVSMIV